MPNIFESSYGPRGKWGQGWGRFFNGNITRKGVKIVSCQLWTIPLQLGTIMKETKKTYITNYQNN